MAAKSSERIVQDLPIPYSVQVVALDRAVTLNWKWQPPERAPEFTDFGFEVERNDGKTSVVSTPTFTDFDVTPGTYSYHVRARGAAKSRGQRITHVSGWSESVGTQIRSACRDAPQISLQVEPTQQKYSSVSSLRLRLRGNVTLPQYCRLTSLSYHIDNGTGNPRVGYLRATAQGAFDTTIDALSPDDVLPEGPATFTVTATAQDEAGPVTSSAYTFSMELQNRFAPQDNY